MDFLKTGDEAIRPGFSVFVTLVYWLGNRMLCSLFDIHILNIEETSFETFRQIGAALNHISTLKDSFKNHPRILDRDGNIMAKKHTADLDCNSRVRIDRIKRSLHSLIRYAAERRSIIRC